nr:outer membrane beta-barrel protein [Halomonas urmiana]
MTENFALEGLLGAAYVSTDYAGGTTIVGVPNPSYPDGVQLNDVDESYSDDDSGFTATYGVGATFAFTDSLTGFARYERIHDIDTADRWGGIEADTASAGLRYNF